MNFLKGISESLHWALNIWPVLQPLILNVAWAFAPDRSVALGPFPLVALCASGDPDPARAGYTSFSQSEIGGIDG